MDANNTQSAICPVTFPSIDAESINNLAAGLIRRAVPPQASTNPAIEAAFFRGLLIPLILKAHVAR
jgi:hypothetical protein